MSRADMSKDPKQVAAMFDGVAKRYDLVNDLLSLGQTKRWRKQVTRLIDPKPGMKILDMAAGPGASSEPLAKAGFTPFILGEFLKIAIVGTTLPLIWRKISATLNK